MTTARRTSPDQLVLDVALPESTRPLQFRLDAATRRRGLAHIAEIRRQAAARQARRGADPATRGTRAA